MKNLECEINVLGGILLSNSAIDKISLKAEEFSDVRHQIIYATMQEMIEEKTPVDLVLLMNKLRSKELLEKAGDAGYLAKIASETVTSALIEYHAKEVRRCYERRLAIAAFAQGLNLANDGLVSNQELFEHAREIENLAIIDNNKYTAIGDCVHETIKNRFTNPAERGFETGLKDLDRYIGRIGYGELVIIAARPSMGKTAFALQIGNHNASNGIPVASFCYEMSNTSITDRILSWETNTELDYINSQLFYGNDVSDISTKWTRAAARIKNKPLYLETGGSTYIEDIKPRIRSFSRELGVKIFIIDYIQELDTKKRKNSRDKEIEEIMKQLRSISIELGVTVFVLSQLSRKCEDRNNKRPIVSDLRDSGSLEHAADKIILLYRDEFYHGVNSLNPTKKPGIAELIVGKNRQGKAGYVSIEVAFIGKYFKFADLFEKGE
jgi:replicative DNA helicase